MQKLGKRAYENKKRYTSEWIERRRKTDPAYAEYRRYRTLLSGTFRRYLQGYNPKSKRLELLTGISTAELMAKLVSTCPNISLDTYGLAYELDHIVPVAEFQKASSHREALEACFHPNNLRIIEKTKNRPGRISVPNRTRVRLSDET